MLQFREETEREEEGEGERKHHTSQMKISTTNERLA